MVYVLLPAYNEEDALRPLLAKIEAELGGRGIPYRVVVVDDGSKDATPRILRELASQYPIDAITHRYNRGLGETARDGFEFIASVAAPDDIVVRMDCDDTHDPRYILDMMAEIDEGAEVVIASRYQPGGAVMGLDWYRRTISRIANLLFKSAFPMKGVWEYTCGFRAYRASTLQDALAIFGNKFIDLKGLGFTGTLEKLIKFRMMGARVKEIPFVLRYDQKMSQSKVVTSITTLGCFILIIKHFRYWNQEGKRWQQAILERRKRVYAADGTLLAARRPESTAEEIEAVRRFWNENPLFAGESSFEHGERDFFEEHERVTLFEHSGEIDRRFLDGVVPGNRVLDVGCGIGFWTAHFARRGAGVSACDLTERAVELTKRRLQLQGLKADVRVGNAEELPYADASFDHVNCQGVIHHTPQTEQCVREFFRVLKPGGTVCFSVYYRMWLFRHPAVFRAAMALSRPWLRLSGRGREGMLHAPTPNELVRQYDGKENPIGRAYSRAEVDAMLGQFEVIDTVRFGFPRRAIPVPIPAAFHRFLSRRFGLMIVYRCRKPADAVPAVAAAPEVAAEPAAAQALVAS